MLEKMVYYLCDVKHFNYAFFPISANRKMNFVLKVAEALPRP